MATLALSAVGAAVGSAVLPAGVSLFGATLTGATIGAQVGAFAGAYVDQALFGGMGGAQTMHGPRLSDLHVMASTEGSPLPRVYGRARIGGQLIWADEIEEEVVTSSAPGSGKGLGGGGAKTKTYNYYASFAVALCEGEISGLGRIWADGQELDRTELVYRVHKGSEDQLADELIVARLGSENASAFRGVAYVVFDRLALAAFGNRVPQLSFEVFRDLGGFGTGIRGVVLIPGSGEFVYATEQVSTGTAGANEPLNVNTRQGGVDWSVSLDQMRDTLPSTANVSLVVSWFATDLRAGNCEIVPGVDSAVKATIPIAWSVAGLTRSEARLVSRIEDRAAYGGTPSDASVIAAIKDLRGRGYGVTLTPFILMDIPADNALADPYTGAAAQPAYPWRGRITCDPAPQRPGSVDKTPAAASQIASFVGSVAVDDFSISGETVQYAGPAQWSFRRMVLHYAHLAKAAGGIDTFVIGTELRGLTTVRSAADTYPFVEALRQLAADVKSVLGSGTKVTYAADWSEYFGHQPDDGSGDVYFHLDPLWSSTHIDAIGIDLYWPLADWRDGTGHLDALAGARSIYALDYLAGNVAAGEGYDWFYASMADRQLQVRTPITDGAYGKPWVYRFKDVASWWSEPHYDRPGGIERTTPTAWSPRSKPVWLMEIGCPAVDRGANQPNVFVDPKSSENALPHFSRGTRDDLMQRQYLNALIGALDPGSELFVAGANPYSTIYGGYMIPPDRVHAYAWDARPYPAFPNNLELWGDGENWRFGHWINGRSASVALSDLVTRLAADFDADAVDASELAGIVPGYVVDRVTTFRDAIQPLGLAFFFDAVESGGSIRLRHRETGAAAVALTQDELVETDQSAPLLSLVRGQETELPQAAKLSYVGAVDDYRKQVAESRRLVGSSGRVSQAELPIVLDGEAAAAIADIWLHEVWTARERAQFALPPSRLELEPGDVVAIALEDGSRRLRVTDVSDAGRRDVEARRSDPSIYEAVPTSSRPGTTPVGSGDGPPVVHFLDLPLLRGDEAPEHGYVAALRRPWPGALAVFRSPEESGFELSTLIERPAVIGELDADLLPGVEGRIDHASQLVVRVLDGELTSVTRLQLLSGRNAAAVRTMAGWEVLQFQHAELVAPKTYVLRELLRGQAGTDDAMRAGASAGAAFVLLETGLAPVPLTLDEIGLPYAWRVGPANRPLSSASYVAAVHAFAGRGLLPYSPVHVRGRRNGAGDLEVSWTRRTRSGGDSWDVTEVPLAEASEAYEIDVLNGVEVKRTFRVGVAGFTYSASDQIGDFGAVQPICQMRIHQMSAVVGRGIARTAVV